MEKEMVSLSLSKLKPRTASTQDLYLDKDFLLWPSFTLLGEDELKQFSQYNIRLLWSQDQGDFLSENALALHLEVHAQNERDPSFIEDEDENRVFWQSYHNYFSFVEKTISNFCKTGKISEGEITQPYTTFNWKLKESKLGLEVLDLIRETAFNDPSRFHIHIIVALTIITTLQGTSRDMDMGDLKDLAFASLLSTLGLFLVPLNQKDLFSPEGFLAHHFTGKQRKAYESYPILSEKIASKNQFTPSVTELVLNHREMLNQKGFPFHPPSFKISQSAQILGISYKLSQYFFSNLEKENLYQSFLRLFKNFGDGYERSLLSGLLDLIVPYKPQNIVELENGSFAKVVKINNKELKKPFLTLNLTSKEAKESDFFVAGETAETAILRVLSESEAKLL